MIVTDRVKLLKKSVKNEQQNDVDEKASPVNSLMTLDEKAAAEIIRESKEALLKDDERSKPDIIIQAKQDSESSMSFAKDSKMTDYEDVIKPKKFLVFHYY